MSLTPARMTRADLLIMEKDAHRVTAALGRLGLLHLVEVRPEQTLRDFVRPSRREELEKCLALLDRLDVVREKIGLGQLPERAGQDPREPMDALERRVASVEERANALVSARAALESESARIQDELARLDALSPFTTPLSRVVDSPFLYFAIGSIKTSDLGPLSEAVRDHVLLLDRPGDAGTRRLIAITSRKGRFALETTLQRHGFTRDDLSSAPDGPPAQRMADITRRVDDLRRQRALINQEIAAFARAAAPEVAFLSRSLGLERALMEAQMNFGHTTSTCLISGWLPQESLATVSELLLKETDGRMILQVRAAEELDSPPEDVPVLMKHNRLIRPFGLLVSALGVPRYDEIEPTLLVAISFLMMYGLMFGDVGQGAVLVLGGGLVWWRARGRSSRDLGAIVFCAGVAAIVGGFLYGSVFGIEHLLHPLLFNPMEKVQIILAVPVFFGMLLISLGVALNIINRFRSRDYPAAILDRFGVVGIIFYWGALGIAIRAMILGKGSPGAVLLCLLIALPLLVLFLRRPILRLFGVGRGHDGEGRASELMHGAIEIMETISTYLANTVSFARVGAFALAHVGLCIAIFSLQEVVRDLPAGAVWSAAVFVLGNALVIALEGLIVFVQCLRLEYYEFFSKFFRGTGKKYAPFSTP